MKLLLQIHNWLQSKEAENISEEMIFGFSLSGIGAMLIPEIVHAIAVIITGVLGTIAIHYTRKWLKK